MALEALTTSITASATVSAGLAENLTLYVTQDAVEVLYVSSTPVELIVTQEAVEVLYTITTPVELIVTQVSVEVLYLTPSWFNAGIDATALVTADLTLKGSIVRLTQQAIELLYTDSDTDTPVRLTQQALEVLYTDLDTDTPVRLTQQSIEVLYSEASGELSTSITVSATVTADLSETIKNLNATIIASAIVTAQPAVTYGLSAPIYAAGNLFAEWSVYKSHLDADITVSAIMTAAMQSPKLKVKINGTGSLYGKLTGKQQFDANIVANALITADIDSKPQLSSAITASAILAVDLRENIEYLAAVIDATGTVTAKLNSPWHAGNSLSITELRQSVNVNIIQYTVPSNVLNLTQEAIAIYGINNLDTSNTINFTQSATVLRTLSTKTASSTLSLSDSAISARRARNYLILKQNTSAYIYFLTGNASSALNLTSTVSSAGSIHLRSVSSNLNLTQAVDVDFVTATNGESDLHLKQNAYGIVLASKKYVVFQAPFEFIQASMVTPSPLMGDTENLISDLVLRRSMAGTRRTYVKSSSNRRLKYTFSVDRPKGLEMEAFFSAYNGSTIKMINWKGEVWKLKLISNPLDYVQTRRAEPNGDKTEVNIEFEGVKLSG